jgi:hypothetical protein
MLLPLYGLKTGDPTVRGMRYALVRGLVACSGATSDVYTYTVRPDELTGTNVRLFADYVLLLCNMNDNGSLSVNDVRLRKVSVEQL